MGWRGVDDATYTPRVRRYEPKPLGIACCRSSGTLDVTRFAHITDLHVVPRGDTLHGLDSIGRVEDCIADINRHREQLSFCVFTGDLVDRGDHESYGVLRELLQTLTVPYHLILGNHDRRRAFYAIFPEQPRDPNGFLQFRVQTRDTVMLFLDTLDEGRSAGAYCRSRQRWLAERLAEAAGLPVYVFMHHPPFDIRMPSLDRMKLDDGNRLAEVLGSGDVRHLFFGHVHRSLSGSWHGIPFSALPSTNHQIATDFETVSPMPYSHGPPAYAFVELREQFVLVNQHPYLHQHPRRLPDGTWSG